MIPNLQGWGVRLNEKGEKERYPIPFDCACGQPANYGLEGQWYCTFCWQGLPTQPWRNRS